MKRIFKKCNNNLFSFILLLKKNLYYKTQGMIDFPDEQELAVKIRKHKNYRYIQTEAYDTENLDSKAFPKWSQNTLYDDVKKRIHEKIKTQITSQELGYNFPIKQQFSLQRKPKSKPIISTLQIVLDPLQKKIKQEPFLIDKKIFTKVQIKPKSISNQPPKIARNMSGMIFSQKNSSRSLIKKQKVLTCRKNTKIDSRLTSTSNNFKTASKVESQDIQFSQIPEQKSFTRFQKSNSEMSKCNSSKKATNFQNIDKNSLLFYFKVKNNLKHSDREMSIKKIRIKSKNNKVFI